MPEAVRLVIWDLDETFWRGTLTEGGIAHRADTHQIVRELATRGIMSGICSRNDHDAVKDILVEQELWDYFIFPSIDWTPKGPRIERLIEMMRLRRESVLFIDDNHLNLEEARFFAPGLQTAPESAIETMLGDPRFAGKDDGALSRLKQYKVLEARKADEGRFAPGAQGDNRDFLRASDIRVRIESDVDAHLDRAIELINRTNQLNFTKRRLPEDIEEARQRLRKELSDFTTQAGLIEVSDRYGDYGYCGYFQVTTRRDFAELRQFCFSCRILDMGVEAWVYQRLGRPALAIHGEVLSDPASHPPVDWIRSGSRQAAQDEGGPEESAPGSFAARGGCILWPLAHYFRLSSPTVVGEFNLVRDGKLIRLDHTVCLRQAIQGVTAAQIEAVKPLGFLAEDFETHYFDHSGPKPLWVLANWADLFMSVLRHDRTGIAIPFQRPKTEEQRTATAALEPYLEAEFSPMPWGEREIKDTLKLIFSRIPPHGLLFLLLITEGGRRPDGTIRVNPRRRDGSRWCVEAAAAYPNVRVLPLEDFIDDDSEILNKNHTHFDRKVYYRLYRHMEAEAQASLKCGAPAA